MTTILNKYIVFLSLALVLISCKRELDSPPEKTIPEGNILTVADLRNMYQGEPVYFKGDSSVYAVVGMAEETGNLYKSAFVQDHTGGIQLRLEFSGGLYEGDSIRIYLKGTTLNAYNGLLQLDSVNTDDNIIKQATNQDVNPQKVTIDQIGETYESQIIRMENVEFVSSDLGKTYADAENEESKNRTVTDCDGNTIIVRTSGFATFADDTLPGKNGTMIAAVGQFGSTYQLFVRRPGEVEFSDPRCNNKVCDPVTSVSEDFSSATSGNYIDLDCWTNKGVQGSRQWIAEESGSNVYAKSTAFSSTDDSNVVWLITPPVNFGGSDQLSFRSSVSNYSHDGLTVWVSTDYDGNSITSATWSEVNATVADSSGSGWVSSGNTSMSSYVSSGDTYYIGFKYAGSSPEYDSDYVIDDVQITQ